MSDTALTFTLKTGRIGEKGRGGREWRDHVSFAWIPIGEGNGKEELLHIFRQNKSFQHWKKIWKENILTRPPIPFLSDQKSYPNMVLIIDDYYRWDPKLD